MKITSGEYEIFESGTVFSYDGEPITFHLDEELVLTLSFKDDPKIPGRSVDSKMLGLNHGNIILTNFNDMFGSGWSRPTPIGTINGVQIFFVMWVSGISESQSTKKIQFSFYRKGEENAI